ncbi:SDR family oxidoreductase [Mycobacterium talmoniae]|uniref:Putative oxidoreductase EphD n=1 Tax=Mycobacterium talmoniae TaxID=1858794 RepID=A0A1S1NGV3_9MYCO|nr:MULTISPECIES: SDR family oxidoreductase [Mycobacterium]OHV04976.1 short-chain dehydrogenase [Mycobacterium talmoniae]PQM48330.1 putative oxidoreductase EphD [Mycobacterium talmoniae]TDH53113.1 SDR family oxidoreductase [Mycobacterium eburneum]
MELENKVVAITGAARGIGLATAKAFLANGAKVAIGDLDAELAEKVAAELGAEPGATVVGLSLDVTDPDSFAAFLDEVEAQLGPLDVLVNNAGIMPTGLFVDESPSMTRRMIDINVHGVVNGSRLAAARFMLRRAGHIVNIASLAGVTGEPGLATYCGTKHFVVGFTESLHRELHPYGVGVSTILPGIINTELSAGTRVPGWAKPLGTAEPEEVAAGIVSAVTKDRPLKVVPAALGGILTSMSLLPAKARFAVAHALKFDQLVSGADPMARAAYHRRLEEQ